jgi:deoxyribose-phosphate aldolase
MNEQLRALIDRISTELQPQLDYFVKREQGSRPINLPQEALTVAPARALSLGSIADVTSISKNTLAGMIDHTLLNPAATKEQLHRLCHEARDHRFATVCVNPCWIKLCVSVLGNSGVGVCTVAGFPLGANSAYVKAEEARKAVDVGATEIDMVLNIGRLKSGDFIAVRKEIHRVVAAVHPVPVKVIIETCLLTDEEKIKACLLAKNAGTSFVKTSTGFSSGGATVQDVALMRAVVGEDVGVKASGGIRSYPAALSMLQAGANRLGLSASIAIITEA